MNLRVLLCAASIGFTAIACDVVDDPYKDLDLSGPKIGDAQFNDTIYNDTTKNIRKIVIEDFTGQSCQNCPKATVVAKNIKAANPDKVIVVAIHNSGFFSEPDPPKYPADFRTETGKALKELHQPPSFPNGMINRIPVGGSTIIGYLTWENRAQTLLADQSFSNPYFQVKIEQIYNTKNKGLRIRPTIKTLRQATGEIHIGAYILEGKIISPQLDGLNYVANYKHEQLLRVGFPSKGVGKKIFTNPNVGDEFKIVSPSDEIGITIDDSKWKLENLTVVTYIYNKTNHEILFADELKLKKP